ncbi:MAG: PKD domain-containing protein [Crocinitomicaceae bacterium]|nr:PKD domain-containing protein [Crocinitomicaceae bacterium]
MPNSGQFTAGTGSLDPSGIATGAYDFTYTLDIIPPCPSDSAVLTVNITNTPVIAFNVIPSEGCEGLEVFFDNQSITDRTSTCLWSFGDSNTSSTSSFPSNIYLNSGFYDVTLTIDNNGCSSTLTQFDAVEIYPQPNTDFNWTSSQIFSDSPIVDFQN